MQYQTAVSEALLRLGQIIENISLNQQSSHFSSTDKAGHSSVPRPPTYHGYNNENITTWIFQVENYFYLRGIGGTTRIHYVSSFLDKHALLWFHQVMQSISANTRPQFESWNDFVQELKTQFIPANLQQLLRKRLRYLKQKNHVLEYINSFRGILSQITTIEEADKINYFIEGLLPAAKTELYYRNPGTLEEAITIANSFFSSTNQQANPHTGSRDSRAPMELGAIRTPQRGNAKNAYFAPIARKPATQ